MCFTVDRRPALRVEHANRYSGVSFKYGFKEGADNSATLLVEGPGAASTRDSIKGKILLRELVRQPLHVQGPVFFVAHY